jgi:hypothetical protein
MTLTPTNGAVRRENHAKNLNKEKKTFTIQEVMKDIRIVFLSKKA